MQEQVDTPHRTAIRIIIADDSPLVRRGICSCIEAMPGYTIIGETGDAEEVLRLCDPSRPDIILLDLHLTCADGQPLIRIIQERYPDIKQVVFVLPEDEEGLAACAMCGVNGCISKNADTDIVLLAVRSVANGERWLQREMSKTMFDGLRHSRQAEQERAQVKLSRREQEVFTFLTQGLRNLEITEQLFISERTVKVHVANIFDKLGVRDRVDAVRYAIRNGMMSE